MDNLSNLDYAEEYGEANIELQPTMLPFECNLTAADNAEQKTIENVHLLFRYGIINWPNFTNCLPNCGLCTQFASDQFYITYNLVVIGLLLPFISLCGLCGNVLSAFVYSRVSLRQSYSGSLYLSALGCSDAAVIITALFLFFVDSIRRYSLALSVVYGSLSPIVYPAAMIAQTCSVYFTLVAGIDCFVQVWLPRAAKDLFARQCFQKATICAVLLFAFLYNVPHCFESILLNCWHPTFQSASVELCPAPLRYNPTYTLIYYKYMYAFFLAVGPLVILIALNTAVIVGTMICKRGNSEDNMALILVVLLFILCNIIALLINIFESHLSSALSWRINYIIDISNLLVVFNSSLNFAIYYNFSRPFRATFLCHFGHKKMPPLTLTVAAPPAPPAQQPNCPRARGGGAVDQTEVNGMHKVMLVTAREHRSPLIGLEKCTSGKLWGSTNGNVHQKRNADRKAYESCPLGRVDEAAEEDGGHWKMRRKMKHDVLCDEDHHRKMKHDVLCDEDHHRKMKHDVLCDEDHHRKMKHDVLCDEDYHRKMKHDD
uniref:G-protein coupled receptors family 1 profile domain-containing protein n=1 Tax=Globodera rostochiensis TaxID=31243 RepID=A0A914I5L2_GLORO